MAWKQIVNSKLVTWIDLIIWYVQLTKCNHLINLSTKNEALNSQPWHTFKPAWLQADYSVDVEHIVHDSNIWLFFVRNYLTLDHSFWNGHQYMTKTYSWWVQTLYVSKAMLPSKLISYKNTLSMFNNITHFCCLCKRWMRGVNQRDELRDELRDAWEDEWEDEWEG